MMGFFQSFDNREIAIFIWLIVLFAWAIKKSEIRSSMVNLIQTASAKPIVVSVIVYGSYFSMLVWLLTLIGIWNQSQLKLTLLWFFSAGLAGIFASAKAVDGKINFKDKAKSNFSISIFFDFFVNMYRMPIFLELLFVPIAAFLAAVVAYSGYDEKYKKVETLGTKLLVLLGIILLIYAIYMIAANYTEVATPDNIRFLILPILFSLGMLPLFWVGMIYSSYENIFIRVPFLIQDKSLHKYTKLSLAKSFRSDTKSLHQWFKQAWHLNLDTKEAIDASIAEFNRKII